MADEPQSIGAEVQSTEASAEEAAPAPLSLPPRVMVLKIDVKGDEHVVYVLGTAHISRESVEDARKLIRAVRPKAVMVELCQARQGMLTMSDDLPVPSTQQMLHSIRVQRTPIWQVVYGWLLAKLAEEVGMTPGAEFRAAAEAAQEVDAAVCLGDRPVNITIARVWAALSPWHKLKFLCTLLWTGLSMPDAEELRRMFEELKETDALTQAMLELAADFPTIMAPLITERDQYMVAVLRDLAQEAPEVVAVVGAGHLSGIREHWERDIDVVEIMRMPAKRRSWRPYILALGGLTVASALVLRRRRTAS